MRARTLRVLVQVLGISMITESTHPRVHELFLEAFERGPYRVFLRRFLAALLGARDAHPSSEPDEVLSERGFTELAYRARIEEHCR